MKKYIVHILFVIIVIGIQNAHANTDLVDIHGFISQGYLKSDHNNYFGKSEDGSFQFNETGLNFRTKLTPDLSMGLQLFSHDLGEWGNDEIEVDWAFADYRYNNWLGIRAGSLKIDLGLYNKVRDVDALRTSVLLPPSIYQESFRESYTGLKGVGIYGRIPGGFHFTVGYGVKDLADDSALVQAFVKDIDLLIRRDVLVPNNLLIGMDLAAATLAAQSVNIELPITNIEVDYSLNFALHWMTPLDGLKLSVSYSGSKTAMYMDLYIDSVYRSEVITKMHEMSTRVFSMQYMFGDTIISAEYSYGVIDIAGGAEGDVDQDGYYASVSHKFLDWLDVGIYYSEYFPDNDDKDGKKLEREGDYPDYYAWLKDACLSTRFDINEYWSFKLEGHKMNGIYGITIERDEDPFATEKDWYLFTSKFSYSF